MKLDGLTDDEYGRVLLAVHEAAHAVMAVLAGGDIRGCFAKGGHGGVDSDGYDPERAAGIAWAGPFAELLLVHGVYPPETAVREAFASATPADRAHMEGGRPRSVESDVRFAMPAIRKLAAFLYQHERATSLQVHGALGVRSGVDIDMVRWAYRNRIDPATITPVGAA